jgi:hypothetical protein
LFDPDAMLDVLDDHAVRYVVIGGMSERIHGIDRSTEDLDACVSSRGGNLEPLADALRELDAVSTGGWSAAGFLAPLGADFFADVHCTTLTTPIEALDVILRVLPYGACEDLLAAPASDGRSRRCPTQRAGYLR